MAVTVFFFSIASAFFITIYRLIAVNDSEWEKLNERLGFLTP